MKNKILVLSMLVGSVALMGCPVTPNNGSYWGTKYYDVTASETIVDSYGFTQYSTCYGYSVGFTGWIDPYCSALTESQSRYAYLDCYYDDFFGDTYTYNTEFYFPTAYIAEICKSGGGIGKRLDGLSNGDASVPAEIVDATPVANAGGRAIENELGSNMTRSEYLADLAARQIVYGPTVDAEKSVEHTAQTE